MKQVKVDTNSVLQLLLVKVDHFERLATVIMVGLDQLFKFEGFFLPVLKFELFVQYLVKTECKAFKCLES